jgi:hypothetical protein
MKTVLGNNSAYTAMIENRYAQSITLYVSAATVVLRIFTVARTFCFLVLLSGLLDWTEHRSWRYSSACALIAVLGYATVRYAPRVAAILTVVTPWIFCCLILCGKPIGLFLVGREELDIAFILLMAVAFWTVAYFASLKMFWPLLRTAKDPLGIQIAHQILMRPERTWRRYLSYRWYLLRTGKPHLATGAYIAGLVTAIGLVRLIPLSPSDGVVYGLVVLLAVAIRYCWGKTWASLVRPLNESDVQLPNKFCLYLRSFSDDFLEVERSLGISEWLIRLTGWFFVGTIRFEEIVVPIVWRYWPVFGIAIPNQQQPPAGAVRVPTSEDWQSDILRLSSTAERIIAVAGFTSGLRWEVEQVVQPPLIHKLIVLFPPEPKSLLQDRNLLPITALKNMFGPEDEGLDQPIAVVFGAHGEVVTLRAKRLTISKYKTALKLPCLPRTSIMAIARDRSQNPLVSQSYL